MKKINKIHIIDFPKKETKLADSDMSVLLGGNFDNCGTYNLCGQTGRNSCSPHDTTACSGGGSSDTRCSTFTF